MRLASLISPALLAGCSLGFSIPDGLAPRGSRLQPRLKATMGDLAVGWLGEGITRVVDGLTGEDAVDLSEDSLEAIRDIVAEEIQAAWETRDKDAAANLIDEVSAYQRLDGALATSLAQVNGWAEQANGLARNLDNYGLSGSAVYVMIASLHLGIEAEKVELLRLMEEDPTQTLKEIIEDAGQYHAKIVGMMTQLQELGLDIFRVRSDKRNYSCGQVCCSGDIVAVVEQRSSVKSDDWSIKWESDVCDVTCDNTTPCQPMVDAANTAFKDLAGEWAVAETPKFFTDQYVQVLYVMQSIASNGT